MGKREKAWRKAKAMKDMARRRRKYRRKRNRKIMAKGRWRKMKKMKKTLAAAEKKRYLHNAIARHHLAKWHGGGIVGIGIGDNNGR